MENGKWVVELRRKHTDVVAFLTNRLKEGGRNLGVADLVSQSLKEKFSIMVGGEAAILYEQNRDFAEFLIDFLASKPFGW